MKCLRRRLTEVKVGCQARYMRVGNCSEKTSIFTFIYIPNIYEGCLSFGLCIKVDELLWKDWTILEHCEI